MRGVTASIIPIALDNVWGIVFSLSHARFSWNGPSRRRGPITMICGSPRPNSSGAHDIRQAVAALQTDAWDHRKRHARPLGEALISTARRSPFRFAMADSRTGSLSFGSALTRAFVLARRLRPFLFRQERVGVLLPPSVAAALANHALLLLGKIPVNLNYTSSEQALLSCIRQCTLESVLTSRAVIEKLRLDLPVNELFIEDVASRAGVREKSAALLAAAVLPAPMRRRWLGARQAFPDDTATIIFSSGSTGEPKGIELSHWNVTANVRQLGHVFPLRGNDRMLGALPFFHSFGFTVTYALPALLGLGSLYHSHPAETGVIGKLARRYSATFLPSTPTLLSQYARRIPAASFGSLRFVLAGAEKLTDAVIDAFDDRFGIRPCEGYGCTECSPVVCASVKDFRAAGMRQAGARRHSVGLPLPGISVRIVDPKTMEALPFGRPGLLLVRGPNVMRRYFGRPDLTAVVFHGDDYITGDVATLDSSGFIAITDRLSRFAKIGGEMVPLIRVEEALHELAGASKRIFVITSVPDVKRGERLAVLHTLGMSELRGVLTRLSTSDLPRSWTPRSNDFIRVSAIPCLGAGKLDLARVREIASNARSCG
ncbi:MAG: AMP-binding protein [Vicinamibacteria bacterium]|nr:AMP-binding protein [Vicinamibacteria bacterium]